MKIVCDCGAVTEFVQPEDSTYTEDEGWYTQANGDIEITKSYYEIFMKCNKCGKEIWMFT